ncbi:LamB/YcsF family protein [uncultured Ferrimonas sp.]|uniref:LamB/YcsF family protein n=1 Tax=uncultured Ferrimonas sp. TaxID=432640 RepID=UPI00262B7FDF|nr:LamB/YcsF family protein [uncultured Ferrimonas sp.]
MKPRLDLNADLGEGGAYDQQLLPLLTSANICCGSHAGSTALTAATIEAATRCGVAVGAHPGYPDPSNVGRIEMGLSNAQVLQLLDKQLRQFAHLAAAAGATVHHLKLHGALYHRAGWDPQLASILCRFLARTYPAWQLYAQANSPLVTIARGHQLIVKEEGFADRRYLASGHLAPRHLQTACITEPALALQQVQQLLQGHVFSLDGHRVTLQLDTLCLHGDGDNALALTQAIAHFCRQQVRLSAD